MHAYGDRARLENLFEAETTRFIDTHPQSGKNHQKALGPMVSGVPMIWMSKWPGPFPIYVDHAKGSHFTDVDGIDYTDFCLGDTGAMCGHAPDATVKAVQQQIAKGRGENPVHRRDGGEDQHDAGQKAVHGVVSVRSGQNWK